MSPDPRLRVIPGNAPDDDPVAHFGKVRRELEARWPESRIAPSLSRISTLAGLLGDPQRAYPVVHITGTNGKTSTARMIESILHEFGLHTGLMTSPHLGDLRERIRLDGQSVSMERFLAVHAEVAPVLALADEASVDAGGPALSFFEVMTALGFAAFADAPVDVAIVEVGMGGTWDATNIADATVAVIAPIGMDHSEYLGDSIADIAREKAGIIKPGSLVVVAAQPPQALEVLVERAAEVGAQLLVEGVDFGVAQRLPALGGQLLTLAGIGGTYAEVYLPLFGAHQAQNAALALAAVEAFFGAGRLGARPDLAVAGAPQGRTLDAMAVAAALGGVRSPGRLEVVRRSPVMVVDAAHNPHGARASAAALREAFELTRFVGVLGVLAGKDAVGIATELEPVLDQVVITRSTSTRAIPVAELAVLVSEVFGENRVHEAPRLDGALELAVALAEDGSPGGIGGGVLITGSVTVAAEARLLLGAESGAQDGMSTPDHAAPRGMDPQALMDALDSPDDN